MKVWRRRCIDLRRERTEQDDTGREICYYFHYQGENWGFGLISSNISILVAVREREGNQGAFSLIFSLSFDSEVQTHFRYVSSGQNVANVPSRGLPLYIEDKCLSALHRATSDFLNIIFYPGAQRRASALCNFVEKYLTYQSLTRVN